MSCRNLDVVVWTYERDQSRDERKIGQSLKNRVQQASAAIFLAHSTNMIDITRSDRLLNHARWLAETVGKQVYSKQQAQINLNIGGSYLDALKEAQTLRTVNIEEVSEINESGKSIPRLMGSNE